MKEEIFMLLMYLPLGFLVLVNVCYFIHILQMLFMPIIRHFVRRINK